MPITISDTTPRDSYTVGGTPQTAFTVNFEFFADADLKVYVDSTLKTLTTHYTVSGAGTSGGGTVTMGTGVSNATVPLHGIWQSLGQRTSRFPAHSKSTH